MSPLSGPPWGYGPGGRRRAPANPDLRVSDAERSGVADRLSRHYADGRLDQAEFSERMERAVSARTRADLSGLLDDLPPLEPDGEVTGARPRRPFRILMLILIAAVLSAAWHAVSRPLFLVPVPWLLAGVLAFLWLQRAARQRDRRGAA